MVSHREVMDAARDRKTDPIELDKMFWAAETGRDYPLSHRDDGSWRMAKVKGDALARAATDVGRALVYTEILGDVVNREITADKERSRFLMTVMVDDEEITARATGAPGMHNAGVIVVAVMSEIRMRMAELEARRRPEEDGPDGP